jgi:uncharacterized membrane protein
LLDGQRWAARWVAQRIQDVREYAAKIGADERAALEDGLAERAAQFRASGGEHYRQE